MAIDLPAAPVEDDGARFARTWDSPSWIRAVGHKTVGMRYMVTAFAFFLVGGVEAVVMRAQLARADNDVVEPEVYNQLFTLHGSTMMFLFVVPFLEGLANWLLPPMLGARDLPFPRLNAFNYWCYLFGGVFLYASVFAGDPPDAGWFSYVPLSSKEFSPGNGIDFWLLGLTLAEISAIGAAVELIVAVLKTRAPGMALNRLPLFAWTTLAASAMILVAFPPLVVASTLLELDRGYGTHFFDPSMGGNTLLWQHLFWIFGHPEVYVMFLPATGIVSQLVQTYTGRPVVAYPLVVVAIVLTAVMSLGLWVHHMFTTGLPPMTTTFFTAASMTIAIASGVQIASWIATIWLGRPRLEVPMLYVVGFVVTFVAGGITGVMVAVVPFDRQVHDSFFIVAHFHYVLIGGVVFPILAAIAHWLPKFRGATIGRGAGVVSFWMVFVGFHATFFPLHVTGLLGMPRRVYQYDEDLGVGGLNLLSTIGALVMAAGFAVFTVAVVAAALGRGGRADLPPDPWDADSLEWTTPSPVPTENFRAVPHVTSAHPAWRPSGAPPILDAAPSRWRGSAGTSVILGEPESVVHHAAPSAWPLVPAAGLLVVVSGMVAERGWVQSLGVAVVCVGALGWAWRNEVERDPEVAAEVVDGLPVDVAGPRAVGWWGALLLSVALGAVLTSLLFAWMLLGTNAPAWPPPGTEEPALVLPLVTLGLLAVTLGTALAAARVARRGSSVLGHHLLVATLGVSAVVLVVVHYGDTGVGKTQHAYGSTLFALCTFAGAVIAAAVLAALLAAWRSARRPGGRGRAVLLAQVSGLLWATALVTWGAIVLSVHVVPRFG